MSHTLVKTNPADRKRKTVKILRKTGLYAILIILGFIMFYPLLFGFMGSIVTDQEFMQSGLLSMPSNLFKAEWRNFLEVFRDDRTFPSMGLTLVKYLFYAVVNVLTSVSIGFLFAKMRFKGKNIAFVYLLVSMMIPGVALTVPNFVWLSRFPLVGGNNIFGNGGTGFVDNWLIIFVLAWIGPYNIFLCRQSLSTIPDDYKEAAKIDGMNLFSIIFKVYMPMIMPVIALMLFNQFCAIWNDYLFSIVYLPTRSDLYTIGAQSVQIAAYFTTTGGSGVTQYPKVFAIGIITMIPPVAAYAIMQKSLVQGLNVGGLKG